MADVTKVLVGVCDVTFNGVNLGHTKGGVEVVYEPVYHDVMVDKYGETVVERYLRGEKWTAKVPLAEFTIANLAVGMPMGELAGAGNTRIQVGSNAGKRATSEAAELVLHPINIVGRENDIVFYKAFPGAPITLNHKNDEEKLVEVEFMALLDESKSDGNYLGLIGDSAL